MRLHVEQRRLPALHGVAAGALDSIRLALSKLALVFIFVAVGALGEGKLFFEVALEVASFTFHRGVFALERILGLGVIEVAGQAAGGHALPAAGVWQDEQALSLKLPLCGSVWQSSHLAKGKPLKRGAP